MQSNSNNHRTLDLFGFLTLVAAFAALAFSWWTLNETREFNRLSLTPILRLDTVLVPNDPKSEVGLFLGNYGSGVAIIDGFIVYMDEKQVTTNDSLGFQGVIDKMGYSNRPELQLKFLDQEGSAIRPGEVQLLFGTDKQNFSATVYNFLHDTMNRINVRITYHSLYNEVYTLYYRNPVR